MTSFNDYLNEQMKNPEFKAEYEALEPEFAIIQASIDSSKTEETSNKKISPKNQVSAD